MKNKKSLGQIAFEVAHKPYKWKDLSGMCRSLWDRAANAVASEVRKRDKAKKKWIKVSDRLPTKEDEDCYGTVWAIYDGEVVRPPLHAFQTSKRITHWMRTGITVPQPPKEV